MRLRGWRLFAASDRIDAWFLGADPVLDHDESVRWSALANRAQRGRAVGGRLILTERRLIFTPNRIERRRRGQRWSCPAEMVQSVSVQERGANPLSGGVRRRLRLLTSTGPELFVVNDVDAAARTVRSLLGL